MPTTPCTLAERIAASGCYMCFSQKERMAALVYLKALALAAAGGEDLSDVNDLRSAIGCECVTDAMVQSFQIYSADLLATAVTATPPADATELRAAIKCFCNLSEHDLRVAESIIDCGLSQVLT